MLLSASFNAKFGLVFVLKHWKALFLKRFHFKANRKSIDSSKKRSLKRYPPPFERLACFYMTIRGNFERFQYFNFETDFLGNENLIQKNWSTVFQLKALRLKAHHCHTKLLHQKPMLRQIEWWVQYGPITKNKVLSATTLFFWKLCFSLRTSYTDFLFIKRIWCTNDPNTHSPTFWKRWSFIWRSFFTVSILKLKTSQNNGIKISGKKKSEHIWQIKKGW